MTRKKLLWLVGSGGTAAAALAAAILFAWSRVPPDPASAPPEEVARYLASERFAQLPLEQKQVYLETLRQNASGDPSRAMRAMDSLTETERERLHENMGAVFQARMRQEIDRYFELPPEQRVAYLDEWIDRHEAFRRQWSSRREGEPNAPSSRPAFSGRWHGPRRHGGPGNIEHLKHMIKHTSGKDQARFLEFMDALRKRREERGLPPPGPPGRR